MNEQSMKQDQSLAAATTRNMVQATVKLHCTAYEALLRGNLRVARSEFSKAFASINRLLYAAKKNQDHDCLYRFFFPMKGGTFDMDEHDMSPCFQDGTQLRTGRFCEDDEEDHLVSLFSVPLSLTQNSHLNADLGTNATYGFTLPQFVFVTVYNLALSTHLLALKEGCHAGPTGDKLETTSKKLTTSHAAYQQRLLNRAIRLWNLVYSLQWREGLYLRPLHILAMIFNVAQAKRQLVANVQGPMTTTLNIKAQSKQKRSSDRIKALRKSCYSDFQRIFSILQVWEHRQVKIPYKSFFMCRTLNFFFCYEQSQKMTMRCSQQEGDVHPINFEKRNVSNNDKSSNNSNRNTSIDDDKKMKEDVIWPLPSSPFSFSAIVADAA